MKIRTDILRTYTDVHTWVGIVSGLALFIAFYAGAITMFEEPLRRWASPSVALPAAPSLADTPELVAKVIAAHPEAGRDYELNLRIDADKPARVMWENKEHARFGASLDAEGALVVARVDEAPVAQLIDVLHQQVGLPFEHEISMPIMGVIALLYGVALVSGVIVLLPTLAADLFALRIGRNLKRLWLDAHNALGVFSLPFHIVMALSAVVFAYHDQFYATQDRVLYAGKLDSVWSQGRTPQAPPGPDAALLTPADTVARLREQAAGFVPVTIEYKTRPDGVTSARVMGYDDRFIMRAPTYGLGSFDPYTGALMDADLIPGHSRGFERVVVSFFALHFGSYGGNPVRWGYFVLGLAGAFLFYSGNLIWVEARRRRLKQRSGSDTPPTQTRSSRVMASLTVGICLGCIAGISLTIAAAKWLPGRVESTEAWHTGLYYIVFLGCTAWALCRGAPRAAFELLLAAAVATLLIPISSVAALVLQGSHVWPIGMGTSPVWIDIVSLIGALAFVVMALRTRRRTQLGDTDSVWSSRSYS